MSGGRAKSGRIVVADDEAHIRDVVRYALEREGFEVVTAIDGPMALVEIERHAPDLVVLDVSMPGLSGLEVCGRIRATSRVPILFLSARGDEVDRVVGLEIGGDDYLVKPFSPRELLARVKAILRRAEPAGPATPQAVISVSRAPSQAYQGYAPSQAQARGRLGAGPLSIDLERHEVQADGHPVKLTATEIGVLASLYERPGVVLTRGQLMERAYRYDNLVTERTIDTHIRRIRAKFRPAGVDPIETVHGVGYKASLGG